jgi:hypothetical protein
LSQSNAQWRFNPSLAEFEKDKQTQRQPKKIRDTGSAIPFSLPSPRVCQTQRNSIDNDDVLSAGESQLDEDGNFSLQVDMQDLQITNDQAFTQRYMLIRNQGRKKRVKRVTKGPQPLGWKKRVN